MPGFCFLEDVHRGTSGGCRLGAWRATIGPSLATCAGVIGALGFFSIEMLWFFSTLSGIIALGVSFGLRAEVLTGVDPETGLRFSNWESEGVSVRFVQRLPDQTRAFFLARGFDREEADHFALSCVFQTIVRNTAAVSETTPLTIDLADWRVEADGSKTSLALKETWDQVWVEAGQSEAARIAFRWALFPTRQQFEPGDYNWGMTSFGLDPSDRFDLHLVWWRGGQRETGLIEALECAPDSPKIP